MLPNSYYKAGARAVLGIEPRTENHATRPNSQLIEGANDPNNSLHASDTAPHAAAGRVGRGELPKGILLLNLHPELLNNFT